MGSDVPLAIGDSVPLNGTLAPQLTKAYSGERGREGRIPLPDARAENISAAELIVELVKANPGEIILAPVGPQTNIATALALDPIIAEDVAGIVFMGGALGKGPAATRGNITPVAECNIYFDPIAADRVFKSGIDLSMVGLDVTNAETGLMLTREDLAGIDPDHSAAARLFLDVCATYLDAPMFNLGDGAILYDPLAVLAIADGSVGAWEDLAVGVETQGALTLGETVLVELPAPNLRAMTNVDGRAAVVAILEAIENRLGTGRLVADNG